MKGLSPLSFHFAHCPVNFARRPVLGTTCSPTRHFPTLWQLQNNARGRASEPWGRDDLFFTCLFPLAGISNNARRRASEHMGEVCSSSRQLCSSSRPRDDLFFTHLFPLAGISNNARRRASEHMEEVCSSSRQPSRSGGWFF